MLTKTNLTEDLEDFARELLRQGVSPEQCGGQLCERFLAPKAVPNAFHDNELGEFYRWCLYGVSPAARMMGPFAGMAAYQRYGGLTSKQLAGIKIRLTETQGDQSHGPLVNITKYKHTEEGQEVADPWLVAENNLLALKIARDGPDNLPMVVAGCRRLGLPAGLLFCCTCTNALEYSKFKHQIWTDNSAKTERIPDKITDSLRVTEVANLINKILFTKFLREFSSNPHTLERYGLTLNTRDGGDFVGAVVLVTAEPVGGKDMQTIECFMSCLLVAQNLNNQLQGSLGLLWDVLASLTTAASLGKSS